MNHLSSDDIKNSVENNLKKGLCDFYIASFEGLKFKIRRDFPNEMWTIQNPDGEILDFTYFEDCTDSIQEYAKYNK